MKEYIKRKEYSLYHGSMLDMRQVIESSSIDAIVTDPPYELGFMGKDWDNSGIAFQIETWKRCLEVLKPGGYLLAFGGSRTFHRIACAIEDAGFEIRDTVMWVYGSGFPKSMNIGKAVESRILTGSANKTEFKNLDGTKVTSGDWGMTKAKEFYGDRPKDYSSDGHERTDKVNYKTKEGKRWDGWGTCLKPSYEPVIVARKPCEGSTTENIMKYGVGGINVDECRIGNEVIKCGTVPDFRDIGKKSKDAIGIDKLSFGQVQNAKRKPIEEHTGRFPSNMIFTYDDNDFEEVCRGLPNGGKNGSITKRYKMNNLVYGEYGECNTWQAYDDSGSAARYFYCAKASKRDRDEGLEKLVDKYRGMSNQAKAELSRDNVGFDGGSANTIGLNRVIARKNIHPTVKPTDLMQYLVRLVTPDGGVVLDPFNGSGSTGKAVMYENKDRNKGYRYIGIEMNEEYLEISKARIDYVIGGVVKEPEEEIKEGQISIFDLLEE